MPDVVLLNPHTRRSPGYPAVGAHRSNPHNTVTEYAFFDELSRQLWGINTNLYAPIEVGDSHESRGYVLGQHLQHLRPKILIELHFNWLSPEAYKPDHWLWSCTTALYGFNNVESQRFGDSLGAAVRLAVGSESLKCREQIKSWAMVSRNPAGKTTPAGEEILSIRQILCPVAVYLETHTGNHYDSHTKALAALEDGSLALSINTTIKEYLGIK